MEIYVVTEEEENGSVILTSVAFNSELSGNGERSHAFVHDCICLRSGVERLVYASFIAVCAKEGRITFAGHDHIVCRTLIAAFCSFEDAVECWVSNGLKRMDERFTGCTEEALTHLRQWCPEQQFDNTLLAQEYGI